MTGLPVESTKRQVKRLKVLPNSPTGRQFLWMLTPVEALYGIEYVQRRKYIPSKKILPIIMIFCSINIHKGMCKPDYQIQILKAEPSVLFQQVGALYPTLNFAHIRVSANLTEFESISTGICQSARLFRGLSNYTSPEFLDNVHPSIAEAFN